MATFEKVKKNGNLTSYRIRTTGKAPFNGVSFLLASSTYSERAARACCGIVDDLERVCLTGDDISPELLARIDKRPDFKERLIKKGLVRDDREPTLKELFDACFSATFANLAANTQRNKKQARAKVFEYFGKERTVDQIDERAAVDFADRMKSRYSPATCAGVLKDARSVWNWGLETGFIRKERGKPFNKPKRGSFKNPERICFVDKTAYRRLLRYCPCNEWRVILALCRIGGLRNPSETLAARWEDVDFRRNRFYVRSQKTKRYEGKAGRTIPLFPELRDELETLYKERDPKSPFIVTRYRKSEINLRTTFLKIITRAGLEVWERLFQNLRASRAQELNQEGYPPYVVAEWLGHSPEVEAAHYVKANEEDFRRALKRKDEKPKDDADDDKDKKKNEDGEK